VSLVLRIEFELKRQPDVRGIVGNESATDYAYNLIGLSVELNVFADDSAISTKAALL